MNAKEWQEKIIKCCKDAGTFQEYFLPVIETLADILERRDIAQETFVKSGSKVLVKHTNKGGATNIEQNPALRLINDLNRDALAYWRELGLTPKGMKALGDVIVTKDDGDGFAQVLANLGI